MTDNNHQKICCSFQKLIWECLRTQNNSELFKCFEGWIRTGKISGTDIKDVKWDCEDCNDTYSTLSSLGTELSGEKINIAKTLREAGCCQTIPIIRNMDDKVEVERLGFWLVHYKDIMCPKCNEIAYQASIESGFLETFEKIQAEEKKEKDRKVWCEFIEKGPEVVISEIKYLEYLENCKKNPYHRFEVMEEMKKLGYDWQNSNRIEIKRYLFHKAIGKTECDGDCSFEKKVKEKLIN